jgi:cysteine synthase
MLTYALTYALMPGPEILLQLASIGVKPAAFVAGVGTGVLTYALTNADVSWRMLTYAGVGTGGTIMGVARAIRSVAGLQHVRMLTYALTYADVWASQELSVASQACSMYVC